MGSWTNIISCYYSVSNVKEVRELTTRREEVGILGCKSVIISYTIVKKLTMDDWQLLQLIAILPHNSGHFNLTHINTREIYYHEPQ